MSQLEREHFHDTPIRLGPLSTHSAPGPWQGRCAACDGFISRKERAVRMYGEVFHSGCAFHPPRSRA